MAAEDDWRLLDDVDLGVALVERDVNPVVVEKLVADRDHPDVEARLDRFLTMES